MVRSRGSRYHPAKVPVVGVLTAVILLVAPDPAVARAARADVDLTGDGRPDVVVAAVDAVVVTHRNGAVAGILRPPTTGDDSSAFSSLATGDFDGDGHQDLAVGDSASELAGQRSTGAVFVYPGGTGGVMGSSNSPQTITENDLGGLDTPESNDRFGGPLATGDIDRDGYDDLVVGASADWVGGVRWAGEVFILRGGPAGLDPTTASAISQATPGVAGAPEANDFFGGEIALDDVTGDGWLDLVVTAAGETMTVSGEYDVHGAVYVFRGGRTGISTTNVTYAKGTARDRQLGDTLATGDISGDGKAEILVASIGEVSDSYECGTISVFKGTAAGISSSRARWSQDVKGVPGVCVSDRSWDGWGYDLAIDDLNGDGYADAVVSDTGDSVANRVAAGSVTVLFGRSSGLTTTGAVRITQNTANVAGVAEAEDYFGSAVAIHDLNGDKRLDLVVATENERVGDAVRGQIAGLLSTITFRPGASSWSRSGTSASPSEPLIGLGSDLL